MVGEGWVGRIGEQLAGGSWVHRDLAVHCARHCNRRGAAAAAAAAGAAAYGQRCRPDCRMGELGEYGMTSVMTRVMAWQNRAGPTSSSGHQVGQLPQRVRVRGLRLRIHNGTQKLRALLVGHPAQNRRPVPVVCMAVQCGCSGGRGREKRHCWGMLSVHAEARRPPCTAS